ncbi:MAG: hypothetical protein ACPF8V_00775 [Luteibaculum sp.]
MILCIVIGSNLVYGQSGKEQKEKPASENEQPWVRLKPEQSKQKQKAPNQKRLRKESLKMERRSTKSVIQILNTSGNGLIGGKWVLFGTFDYGRKSFGGKFDKTSSDRKLDFVQYLGGGIKLAKFYESFGFYASVSLGERFDTYRTSSYIIDDMGGYYNIQSNVGSTSLFTYCVGSYLGTSRFKGFLGFGIREIDFLGGLDGNAEIGLNYRIRNRVYLDVGIETILDEVDFSWGFVGIGYQLKK